MPNFHVYVSETVYVTALYLVENVANAEEARAAFGAGERLYLEDTDIHDSEIQEIERVVEIKED